MASELSGPAGAFLCLEADSDGSLPGYPFRFRVRITYSLSDAGFASELEVQNTGNDALPFVDGWHPYFTWNGIVDHLELRLPACRRLEIDARKIPTGKSAPFRDYKRFRPLGGQVFDDGFYLEPSSSGRAFTEVYDPVTQTVLHVWQQTGPGKYNFLQVYTPADRRSLALEPMMGAADAFNNGLGLVTLQPGESATARFGATLSLRYQS